MKVMKAYKEGKYLVFKFEDGKDVKYDLATGQTIGKSGRPVKSICEQFRGYNLSEVIESFEKEEYRKFLEFLDREFINKSYSGDYRVSRVKNIGTFLSRIKQYDRFEKYFAAGVYNVSPKLKTDINDVPRGLLKWCRERNVELTDELINKYKENHNLYNWVFEQNFITLTTQQAINYLLKDDYYLTHTRQKVYHSKFYELIYKYNYSPKPLLLYIDRLFTYEALNYSHLTILVDYCHMMNQLSPKYEKYPKNLLTTHQIAIRNYKRLQKEYQEEAFKNIIDKTLEWHDDNFIVIYPESTQDIKDEAVQQHNCVASYIDHVINGICHIVFMRRKNRPEKSLVTIEVRNYKVVQYEATCRRELRPEEREALNKYKKYLERLSKKSVA